MPHSIEFDATQPATKDDIQRGPTRVCAVDPVAADLPRTLFSLKITGDSLLNLRIENVFTPPSLVENSIGFQTVDGTALTGVMHIALANVFVRQPDGTVRLLTGANPDVVGGVTTRGDRVYVRYGF